MIKIGRPVRIAMIMGKMIGGGVESVVMNYYRNIDKKEVQFDFIIDEDSTIVPEKEILSLGGKIYKISPCKKIFKYNKELDQLLKKNNYSIVHSNINSLSVFPLRIAYKNRVPIRIAHNHSTSSKQEVVKDIIKKILRTQSTKYATHYMAPTLSTGKWLFGDNIEIKILPNAINLPQFYFDEKVREQTRIELGYSPNDFVIGNIGRLVSQKNHFFLVKVFAEYRKENSNAKLLIVGEGPLKKELIELSKKLGVINEIKILPNTLNVSKYYNAMDLLIFPSKYEGLGIVAVEAQVSKLPVLLSKDVPKEVVISENVNYLSLEDSITEWSNKIIVIQENISDDVRTERTFLSNNYDISIKAADLVKYYLELLSGISTR